MTFGLILVFSDLLNQARLLFSYSQYSKICISNVMNEATFQRKKTMSQMLPTQLRTSDQLHTIRLSSSELSTYRQLPELVRLIDTSFVDSWKTIPGLIGPDHRRYNVDEEYVDDMGQAGVVFVILDGESTLVATAGYRPWKSIWKTTARLATVEEREKSEQQIQLYVSSPMLLLLCSLDSISCLKVLKYHFVLILPISPPNHSY